MVSPELNDGQMTVIHSGERGLRGNPGYGLLITNHRLLLILL